MLTYFGNDRGWGAWCSPTATRSPLSLQPLCPRARQAVSTPYPLRFPGLNSISWVQVDLGVSPPSFAHYTSTVKAMVTSFLASTSRCWFIWDFLSTKTPTSFTCAVDPQSHILCVSGGYSEPQGKQRSLLPFMLVRIDLDSMLISALLRPFWILPLTFLYCPPTFPHAPWWLSSSVSWVNQYSNLWSQTYLGSKSYSSNGYGNLGKSLTLTWSIKR